MVDNDVVCACSSGTKLLDIYHCSATNENLPRVTAAQDDATGSCAAAAGPWPRLRLHQQPQVPVTATAGSAALVPLYRCVSNVVTRGLGQDKLAMIL